jgi:hypothetical protein
MVHENWIEKDYVQWWLDENPTVKRWLTEEVTKLNTQYDYGYNLMRFCEGVWETPERLVDVRISKDSKLLAAFREKHSIPPRKRPDEDGSYVILDLLKKFIRQGKLTDLSPHNLGAEIDVAGLSKTKRHGLYAAVRAFFKSETVSAALPLETFKIAEGSRVGRADKDFTMRGREGIEQAKKIIVNAKEPYRTLFWAALYGCMGDAELCTLNEQWPQIQKQLIQGRDPIQVSFEYRKTNNLPYYTFVPARIFQPYTQCPATPFLNTNMGKKGGGKPVTSGDLIARWHKSRDRADVGLEVGIHNMRDLWDTYAVKAGLRPSVAIFLMGHSLKTIDPNSYNQIYKDVDYTMEQWEMMRKFIDGETEEWRKPVEELKQRLDKSEFERRDDLRQANLEFLRALGFSPRQIKRIRDEHNGDLANITKEEKRKIGEQVKARLGHLKPTAGKEGKPPPRLRVPKEEAELLMEQGWEEVKVFESGNVLLEWRYATPPPKRPLLVPSK